MNYSTAVFLINDAVRAITCKYEPDDRAKDSTFKTMDASIKVDDLVIVPTSTRHGFTVVKVTAVDLDVDFDCPTQMAWVVGKVDVSGYEVTLAQEQEAISAIHSAERNRKRAELKNALLADVSGLKTLAIAGSIEPSDTDTSAS
jgi:hypothetical protein